MKLRLIYFVYLHVHNCDDYGTYMFDMKRIGERIKKKRESIGLHLHEVAERVGVSSSALSQIEKAKSFPSIMTLKSIADCLHTSVGELIGENESLANNPVVLKDEEKFIDQNEAGTSIHLLSHHDLNKHMDTYLVRFAPFSGIGGLFPNPHGQVFCHVLRGEIRFDIDGKSFVVKQGDNIYFNAKLPHGADNLTGTTSEMLWVQSPPHL